MQTLLLVLAILFSLVALIASLLLIRGLFPARVEIVRQVLEDQWKRSFWIGLLNTVLITIFVIGLGGLADSAPIFFFPAFLIYGAFLIGLLFGLAAFVRIVGQRLFPDQNEVRKDIQGGAVYLLSSSLPVVGWFLLFPYGVFLSVGAVVITLFQNRKTKRNPESAA